MKKGKLLAAVLVSLAVIAGAYTAVSAAAGSADPLVTLSYLTGKFTPQAESKMKAMVDERAAELTRQLDQAAANAVSSAAPGTSSGASVFSVVTLSKGQTLVGDVGCELMLRVGSASCSSGGSTGLIDVTDASTLAEGKALVKNHLYMVTIKTRSVTAAADTVKLLVRGPYTIA